jgi:3-hydroxypropanoate dehydrogenase
MSWTVETSPAEGELAPLDEAAQASLFSNARTANAFTDTPVSDAELAAIWDMTKWAPTAANMQPLRVLYVTSDEARARLVSHMAEGNKAKTLAAPAVAVLAYDSRFYEHVPTVMPFMPHLEAVFSENKEMGTQTATFNSALQSGYFVLAVRAAGLAAGPMSGFDADGVNADFFADGRWRSILVVNIGHPDESGTHDRLPRLDNAEAISWA